jgi:SAM-dependent methyltransferase
MAPRYFRGAGRMTPALMGELLHDLGPAEACVDLACGPGLTTRRIAEALPDATVLGVDISPAMVAQARIEAPELRFELGRDTAIPVDDGSQDYVFCSLGLMLFPNAADALAEIARVLRDGGELRCGVWGRAAETNFPTFGVALANRLGHDIPPPPRSNFHLGEPEALAAIADGTRLSLKSWRRHPLRFRYTAAADVCANLGMTEDDPGPLKDLLEEDAWPGFVVEAEREAARLLESGDGSLVLDTLVGVFA